MRTLPLYRFSLETWEVLRTFATGKSKVPVRLTFSSGSVSPPILTAPVCGPPRFHIRRALLFYPSAPQDKDFHSLLYPYDLDGTMSDRAYPLSGTRDGGYLYVIRTSVSVSSLANNSTIAIVYLKTIWLREQIRNKLINLTTRIVMSCWQYGEQLYINSKDKIYSKAKFSCCMRPTLLGIEWYLKTSKQSRKTLPSLACEQMPLLSENVGERDVCE